MGGEFGVGWMTAQPHPRVFSGVANGRAWDTLTPTLSRVSLALARRSSVPFRRYTPIYAFLRQDEGRPFGVRSLYSAGGRPFPGEREEGLAGSVQVRRSRFLADFLTADR